MSRDVRTPSGPSRRIELIPEPGAEMRERIAASLAEFNAARAGQANARALCVAVRSADGELEGGLWGVTLYHLLAIELLFVPDQLRGRGFGATIVGRAEQEARARGCIGAWLDTFSFQARGFYERLGYELAGTIPDHPKCGARYFLMKRF